MAVMDQVRRMASIYKVAGAVHGCALLATISSDASAGDSTEDGTEDGTDSTLDPAPRMLRFVEDVGRHNAVDAIAGWMWLEGIDGTDKIFYTTGRLTSEMVIKGGQMGIPFLLTRSGVTKMGLSLAKQIKMTIMARCSGEHFLIYEGAQRIQMRTPSALIQVS
jgi:FdhD protein